MLGERVQTKVFSSHRDYLRSLSLEGLRPLVLAAASYFAVAMILLIRFAPPHLLGWLLLQKSVYVVLALKFSRHLKQGRFPLRRSEAYSGLVLLMCLSSALFTAGAGLHGSFSAYSAVLLLGISMVEVSWKRASAYWSLVWIAWVAVYHSRPFDQGLLEFSKLVGVQLVAVTALGLRLRMALKQYQLIEDLAEALTQSELTRQSLDAAVEERTAELRSANQEQIRLQDQLIQSQKMESLGRLAGGVAHDFNNFLTVILGNLELLRSELTEGDRVLFLSDAESAVNRAAELTGQLLAFSRKEVFQVEPVKIQTLVQDSLRMAERLLGEDIRLQARLECAGVLVEGDRTRLQQALLNLIVNARDAMPGGGQLFIELLREGSRVLLTVRDTGCGMDETTQKRVLEPFFTTKPVGHGTGLGLSTVDGIVSMHSGKLTIASKLGEGTTFTIFLPVASVMGSDSLGRKRGQLDQSQSGRVLLVEDDDQVRTLTARLLRLLGYQVQALPDGDTTLAWLETHKEYDLLITDAVMPGMDGGKLADAVQAILPKLPVLFISGYADDRLSHCGIAQGSGNFLAKPFTPAQLQAKLLEVLHK